MPGSESETSSWCDAIVSVFCLVGRALLVCVYIYSDVDRYVDTRALYGRSGLDVGSADAMEARTMMGAEQQEQSAAERWRMSKLVLFAFEFRFPCQIGVAKRVT